MYLKFQLPFLGYLQISKLRNLLSLLLNKCVQSFKCGTFKRNIPFKYKNFETTAFFIHFSFFRWIYRAKCYSDPIYIHLNLLKVDSLFVKLLNNDS